MLGSLSDEVGWFSDVKILKFEKGIVEMSDKNIDFKELEKALIKLFGKIELIEELQKHRGDKFNIFSI